MLGRCADCCSSLVLPPSFCSPPQELAAEAGRQWQPDDVYLRTQSEVNALNNGQVPPVPLVPLSPEQEDYVARVASDLV